MPNDELKNGWVIVTNHTPNSILALEENPKVNDTHYSQIWAAKFLGYITKNIAVKRHYYQIILVIQTLSYVGLRVTLNNLLFICQVSVTIRMIFQKEVVKMTVLTVVSGSLKRCVIVTRDTQKLLVNGLH